MTKPRADDLRFACPRCMARLRARASQAGTRQRCPQCQYQFVVPEPYQAAASARRAEEYSISQGGYEGQLDPAKAAQTAGVAACSTCGTRSYAPLDQVGHQIECPDCGSKVVVARRPERPPDKPPSAAEQEAYALLDQLQEPAGGTPESQRVHIPVHCPVCDTLLHGTLKEVGKHLLCPDCFSPVLVPPLEAVAKPKPVPEHDIHEEYALLDPVPAATPGPGASLPGESSPGEGRPAEPPRQEPLIPVVCMLCQTRMYATLDQVGEMITCPDCGTPAVVPRPEPPLPKLGLDGTAVGEYGTSEPAERAEHRPPPEARVWQIVPGGDTAAATAAMGARASGIAYERPEPPRWPFWSGVVGFLWQPGTWPRVVALMSGLLLISPMMAFAFVLLRVPNAGTVVAVPWIVCMILFAGSLTLLLVWGMAAWAIFLAVIQDTAEGNDQIEDWPDAMITDWAFEASYLVTSFVVSLIPGVILFRALMFTPLPYWTAIPASWFFMFPLVLLSMLAEGSPLAPISGPVWASVLWKWWAWALFYLEAAVLLALYFAFANLMAGMMGVWGLIPISLALVIVAMIYCRLLGRLAWCCTWGAEEGEGERRRRAGRRARRRADTAPGPSTAAAAAPLESPAKSRRSPAAAPRPGPSRSEEVGPPSAAVSAPKPAAAPKPSPPRAPVGAPRSSLPPSPPPEPPPPPKPARSILDDDFDVS